MVSVSSSCAQHDSPKKNQFIGLIRSGQSIAQAAQHLNIPYSTARDILNKWKKYGSTSNRPRPGHPKKVTDRGARRMVRTARVNRRMGFQEIGNQMAPTVTDATVRNILDKEGYHRRLAKKVPNLTKTQKKKWVIYGKKYKEFTEEDWERVAFSDECYIYIEDSKSRVYVTHRPDEQLLEECLVPSFKLSSICVMVWGCIMKDKKGPLVVLEYPGGKGGGMTSKRYQEQVLDAVLKDFYTQMKETRGSILFQQDSAPSHMSKSTKQWFRDHGIPLLYHPPSSPDMNPIELLRLLPHPPTTVRGLQDAVCDAWDSLPIEDINKHVNRMQDRVEDVLAAKGGHTRY
ncbi:hypothetical protein C8Q75DRAFT_796064 [Abortiporus biennis]|nr:hypothetical protein C8Q75DRAFT_796064 [Abortiporus biennis]